MPPSAISRDASSARDIHFDSSMSRFYTICSGPAVLEIGLILWAVHEAMTVPGEGDPTLRYVSVGIPLFWAILNAVGLLIAFMLFNGQQITLTPRAFVFRRGRLTVFLPWQELSFAPAEPRRFDRQFSVSTRTSHVVVRSLFFPRFDEMQREIEARLKSRDSRELRL